MRHLIAAELPRDRVVLCQGRKEVLKIGANRFADLLHDRPCPSWLVTAARAQWGIELDGVATRDAVTVRTGALLGFVRATHEVNLGCNYACKHCYLGLKKFRGMSWPDRERLIQILVDAGVVWLQLTGGEPMVDPLFPGVYQAAWDAGMMISVLTNGSRLHTAPMLELFTARPAEKITISVYGASQASYDELTQRRGAFNAFTKGVRAGTEAGLPLAFSLIVTADNAHELEDMKRLSNELGVPYEVFSNMSPTIQGSGQTLPSQAAEYLRARKPFTGCNAGHTFFHVDPFAKASICKIGRDPNVDLLTEGAVGLAKLNAIADQLMLRAGACTGCTIQGTCGTCPPLVKLYREAHAPLNTFCQHGHPREEASA